MDQLSNVTMGIFKNFPDKIYIEKNIILKKISKVYSIKNYAKNLSKLRNYFKDYFVDAKPVTLQSTEKYLNEIKKSKNKIMYIIYLKKRIIGQYGVHQWENNSIGLDGAMRVSKDGPKDLFFKIQKLILKLLKKKINKCSPVIIFHKKNLMAINLHSKFNFKKVIDKSKLKFFKNYIKSKKNKVSEFYIKELR